MAGEVCITLVEQDYIDANRAYLLRSFRQPKIIARYALLFGGLAVILAAIEWTDGEGRRDVLRGIALPLAAGAAGLLFCLALGFLLLPRRTRRIFRQTAALGRPYRYIWSEQGLGYSSDSDNGTLAWSDFYRWSHGRKGFLLMINERVFLIIPGRVLSAAQAEDLLGTIEAYGPARI